MIFGSKVPSSFLMSAIHSFLKFLRYKQTQTSSGNVENLKLRFGSPLCDHFLTLLHPSLDFGPYFGNHGGTEFMGGREDMSPPTFGQGGHHIVCPPQHFVIKRNAVVQISCLHHCCKRFPSIKPGNN